MAIQNFLSGGYYGKLGATVGQRWKNKRTIRVWVKPANPRTEIQQANRSQFANAVEFAQMGMQMNYYATCFEDPGFTHWNYRMKTARELKKRGLQLLDLIPLYPVTFTPPTLLQEITVDHTAGAKHIVFAVPSLADNADRVLSLMFALYNTSDQFLGYKLYLGYYFANDPGFLQVDVDDVNEINSHCFVRAVSNDDEDSIEDMIASPSLRIQAGSIDIRPFNTAIHEVQKTSAGIKVIFAEPWAGAPTVNTARASVRCVVGGDVENYVMSAAVALANENGYCSLTIPLSYTEEQMKPAFPAGSYFTLDIDYEGATWQYTASEETVNYSDSDLLRAVENIGNFSTIANSVIGWSATMGDITSSQTVAGVLRCSGRLGLTSEVSVAVGIHGNNDGLLHVEVEGDYARYPMRANDYLCIPQTDIVSNGVTYRVSAQTLTGVNLTTTSYFFETLNWEFYRDGGSAIGDPLYSLQILAEAEDGITAQAWEDIPNIVTVAVSGGSGSCSPYITVFSIDSYSGTVTITFDSNFANVTDFDRVTSSSACTYTVPEITVDGIVYTFSSSWMGDNFPSTVGGYQV